MAIAMRQIRVALPLLVTLLVVAACGSSSSGSTRARSVPASPGGSPPSGAPSGGSSTPRYTATGIYTLSGGTATLANRSLSAHGTDESGVLVKDSGLLTLKQSSVSSSGSSKSSDESSFYGLDAGVLAQSRGKVRIIGGAVATTGAGANGVFAYGSGTSVSVTGTAITATGQYAHGAMASGGGSVTLKNVRVSTRGASSAAIATDRGGGTLTVTGGRMTTTGFRSPGIYSTGVITVRGATMTATGAEAAVVEGANSITAIDTSLTAAQQHGVMLYNSMSGDASAGTATYTMTGGSLTAAHGPAFYVTNTRAVIKLAAGAQVRAASGTLLRADSAGTGSGNTGAGTVSFSANAEKLSGNLVTAGTGAITVSLSGRTTLTGMINEAALTLDSTSAWKLTGDSSLSTLH